MHYSCFVDVLLPFSVNGTFTYAVRPELEEQVKAGIRVLVPFGKKNTYQALVIRLHSILPQDYEVKEVLSVTDGYPVVNELQLKLWDWISEYYMCTPGEVYKAAIPSGLKLESRSRGPHGRDLPVEEQPELTVYQQKALSDITSAFAGNDVVLLHGVTSSGKTEIYTRLIRHTMEQGRQVLYLLPEIALTTQIIRRLQSVFGQNIEVYHSRFTDAQRGKVWKRLLQPAKQADEALQVVLGVRSAIFLPFSNIGLVIIDEEHENTYKQFDPAPRYHARDTALMLARLHGAKVLLGTATPSIESYFNCQTGKYKLVELTERYLSLEMPEIRVVNTRLLRRQKRMLSHFSPELMEGIGEALSNGEQVILFQNRRGFSLYLECDQCGEVPHCKHCDVSLTYHKKMNRLNCHYCGFGINIPPVCPSCGSGQLLMKGFGTEKIEEEINLYFPDARVERLDLDSAHSRKSFEKLIARFELKESDILVGTQMVSKGLDFENVSLVGIMNADTMLNYPDFRAHERSYQLMAQVSGRAGRKNSRGKVIIQASDHTHPVIARVVQHDYLQMYRDELEERRKFSYPPFARLVEITLRHRNKELLDQAADFFASELRGLMKDRVMGPEYPLINKIRNLFQKQVLVKIDKGKPLQEAKAGILACVATMNAHHEFRAVQCVPDVDPY